MDQEKAPLSNVLKHVYNKWDSHRYNGYLKQFDVDPSKKISEMSKGMKSKMMLATALVGQPTSHRTVRTGLVHGSSPVYAATDLR